MRDVESVTGPATILGSLLTKRCGIARLRGQLNSSRFSPRIRLGRQLLLALLVTGAPSLSLGEVTDESELQASAKEVSVNQFSYSLASGYGTKIPSYGEIPTRFASLVQQRTGGQVSFDVHQPNSLVPALKILHAVGSGEVDAGYSSPGYWGGRDPVFHLFSAFPFSPTMERHRKWIQHGAGREAMVALYKPLNVIPIPCGYIGPEGFGWYRSRISSSEDLRGLRLRTFGLATKVYTRMGADTKLLSGAKISEALEEGKIDAAEFSTPYIDAAYNFGRVAKHYYYPAWHQPMSMVEILVNLDVWRAMPDGHRRVILTVCEEIARASIELEKKRAIEGLRRIKAQGVTVREPPSEIADEAKDLWLEIAAELGNESPEFREIFDSLKPYL